MAKVKVIMLQGMQGPSINLDAGQVYECEQEEADRLIAKDVAKPAEKTARAKATSSNAKRSRRG